MHRRHRTVLSRRVADMSQIAALAKAKAYIADRGLSPQSIKDRTCQCRRCIEANQQELLAIVKRAIFSFHKPKTTVIKMYVSRLK